MVIRRRSVSDSRPRGLGGSFIILNEIKSPDKITYDFLGTFNTEIIKITQLINSKP